MKITNQKNIWERKSNKSGFTIVEVMLVVAIAGAMLIGLISGTFFTIAQQRYNDSLRSFTEYLRAMYSHAQSPESLGFGNSNQSILGKLVVFGYSDVKDKVYSATIIGKSDLRISGDNFMEELVKSEAKLYCGEAVGIGGTEKPSTVEEYTLLWQSFLKPIDTSRADEAFKGSLIITRTPTSGAVHTAFAKDILYNLAENCQIGSTTASDQFQGDIKDKTSEFNYSNPVRICLESDDNAIVREIRIDADARNTSGISLIQADSEENKCKK